MCGKYTNYGPVCLTCSIDLELDQTQEELDELEKAVEEILEKED